MREPRCDAMAWAAPSGCDGCGIPLVGRQRRWCAGDCAELYWQNHRYTRAREAALVRARIYCWDWRWVSWTDSGPRRVWTWLTYRCARCGCSTHSPEVNHIEPAMGRHSQESCCHHQSNLEVLCRGCHQIETNRQRAERAALLS